MADNVIAFIIFEVFLACVAVFGIWAKSRQDDGPSDSHKGKSVRNHRVSH